jgi:hypothetical protein
MSSISSVRTLSKSGASGTGESSIAVVHSYSRKASTRRSSWWLNLAIACSPNRSRTLFASVSSLRLSQSYVPRTTCRGWRRSCPAIPRSTGGKSPACRGSHSRSQPRSRMNEFGSWRYSSGPPVLPTVEIGHRAAPLQYPAWVLMDGAKAAARAMPVSPPVIKTS